MTSTNAEQEANSKIKNCIDQALDSYGDSVKQVIYWNLEKMFGITSDRIPENPEKFVSALEKIFGAGAGIVERTIINEISLVPGIGNLKSDDLVKALRTGCRHFQGLDD
ncbi:MAG: hypothetical protein ACRECH_08855 [Nitrososphaerales archaeon]